jgi:hypothetical protein
VLAVGGLIGALYLSNTFFQVTLCIGGVASFLWFLWDVLPLDAWWTTPRRLLVAIPVGCIAVVLICAALKSAGSSSTIGNDISSASPTPNPNPTAMVRDYGPSRPANFTDKSNGNIPEALYFYTTVCFANFGEQDTNVQLYAKGSVIPRNMSPAKVHRMIEGFQDDLSAAAATNKGAVETYPAAEEPIDYLGDCDPQKALHAYSFMTNISVDQFFRLKTRVDAFVYVGRLVERNAQGTTYWNVCGISVSKSFPIFCPGSGSS